jgi:phenylacetate-CoA ligase
LADLPVYRIWRQCDPGPEHPVECRYAALPCTTKALIRAHFPHGFLLPGRDLDGALLAGDVSVVHTSGTTSERVATIWDQTWWDASETASWLLNAHAARAGLGGHREALLANPLSVGVPCGDAAGLPMGARRLGRFLYLNERPDPARWSDADIRRIAAELALFRPAVLEANPSYLARFCARAAALGLEIEPPLLIVLTFEWPSRLHRRAIRERFPDTPLMSSHGSTETGYVFTECEHGRYHQNSAFCRVDIEPLRVPPGDAGVGRLLVTPFDHPWYTLLKFSIGDLVRPGAPCPCGRRQGLTLATMEGRLADVTTAPGGRVVTVNALDEALAAVAGLVSYRLMQTAPDSYRLAWVGAPGHRGDPRPAARNALRELYGPQARIEIADEGDFAPEESGKYRLALMTFPFDYDGLFFRGAPPRAC